MKFCKKEIFQKLLHQPFSLTLDENMVKIQAWDGCGALSPLEQHCKYKGDSQVWQQKLKSTSRSSWSLKKDSEKGKNILRVYPCYLYLKYLFSLFK